MIEVPQALDEEQLRRPFDHYARYRLAAEVVTMTVGPDARVLDLGGGPGSLQAFLPAAAVVACDLTAPSEWHDRAPALVLADGARLPFGTDAFDAVVSLDTLEHVPPRSRQRFLDEVGRVAGGWALVVCPYATPGVADADAALLAYVRNRFAPDLPTIRILEEHLTYGHPDLEESRDRLATHGPVATIPSGRLDRWFAGMITFFHLLALGDDEPVEVSQRFINRNLYTADLAGPAYRHGLVVRTGAAGPEPQDVVDRLTGRAAADPHASADLDLLAVVLGESLVGAAESARSQAAELRRRLEDAEQQLASCHQAVDALSVARQDDARAREALQTAHDELAAFRDRVMANPAVRVGRVARRVLGRR